MKQYRLVDAAKAAVDDSVFIEDVLFVDNKDKPVNVTGGSTSTPYMCFPLPPRTLLVA